MFKYSENYYAVSEHIFIKLLKIPYYGKIDIKEHFLFFRYDVLTKYLTINEQMY